MDRLQHRLNTLIERFKRYRLIPVVILDRAEDAEPLGEALLQAGLPLIEITFRTDAAAEAIRRISQRLPEMTVGAGTVIRTEQAQAALDAGATFIVSPGFSAAVSDFCVRQELPYFPGVVTATEIQMALDRRWRVLKYFPAEASGGVRTLRAIAAPFPEVQFIATGGITGDNLTDYLNLDCLLACGGSWFVQGQLIADGHFSEITRRVKEALARVQGK
ncbi:MAG: bifunctional 4-hydroxy-2-oxoglutarate aldolase/2-dehydro-3-deoxy-phosphogluconate aldolase [candidate division KSB1 bacterium]|nr:bifunctional 4-hydroxy-2-oxoglutarate aldolase/2-dehydro-3-deoxy-phosphogluconate aldolase [candidate division KSB1 bacterium]